MQYSNSYIFGFAALICVVCGVVVAGAAVSLKDRQEANAILDRQKKVLSVVGLLKEGEDSPEQIQAAFKANIRSKVIELKTGEVAKDIEPSTFDQQSAAKDPAVSFVAPQNKAKVARLPKHALVYEVLGQGGKVDKVVLPVEGKGLWSTLYGYLAVENDGDTIAGLTFYQHGETPGLGGEIDNPRWKSLWPGRKIRNAKGAPAIKVVKGAAGDAASAPNAVDGLSGATLTSNGVTYLLQFWTGEDGFGPFLRTLPGAASAAGVGG
jgi:Na+-transporting NADH:ubiquinone oxidoreductase subunit C